MQFMLKVISEEGGSGRHREIRERELIRNYAVDAAIINFERIKLAILFRDESIRKRRKRENLSAPLPFVIMVGDSISGIKMMCDDGTEIEEDSCSIWLDEYHAEVLEVKIETDASFRPGEVKGGL